MVHPGPQNNRHNVMTREANTENYSNQSDTLLQCCSYLTFGLNGKGCGSQLAETKIINDDQTTVLSCFGDDWFCIGWIPPKNNRQPMAPGQQGNRAIRTCQNLALHLSNVLERLCSCQVTWTFHCQNSNHYLVNIIPRWGLWGCGTEWWMGPSDGATQRTWPDFSVLRCHHTARLALPREAEKVNAIVSLHLLAESWWGPAGADPRGQQEGSGMIHHFLAGFDSCWRGFF